jgi:hypothetical protein
MAAVRLAHRPSLVPVEDLLTRLHDLERRLSGGGGSGPRPGPAGPSGGGAPAPSAQRAGAAAPATTTAPARGTGAIPAGPSVTSGITPSQRFTPPSATAGGAATAAAAQVVPLRTEAAPAPKPPPPTPEGASVSWLNKARAAGQELRAEQRAVTKPVAATPSAPSAPQAPSIDLSGVEAVMPVWRQLVDATQSSLGAVLKSAVPLAVSGALVRMAVSAESSFIRRKIDTPETFKHIEDAAEKMFGTRPSVELVVAELGTSPPTILYADQQAQEAARRAQELAARNHPLVQMACEMLGAEVVKVKLEGDGPLMDSGCVGGRRTAPSPPCARAHPAR